MRKKNQATSNLLATLILLSLLALFMLGAAADCTPDMAIVCGK